MTDRPVIAVVGATGSQGGGLARAITADPDTPYRVRALTRDVDSDAARRLVALGADVVPADLDDASSVQAAFEGAQAAFVVTNYWAPLADGDDRSPARRELAQAEAAATAAARAEVAHVVWSTLEDTRDFFGVDGRVPVLEDGFTVPHFDAKAQADEFFTQRDVPTTFLRTTLFYEGFAEALAPRRDADGRLTLALPIADQPVSSIAVGDIGKVAYAIFRGGAHFAGRTVSIAGDHLTGAQYAAALTDALGETVTYRAMDYDEYRAQDFPGAVEMGNMFQYYAQNSAAFVGARDLTSVRSLDPELASFADWLALHARDFDTAANGAGSGSSSETERD